MIRNLARKPPVQVATLALAALVTKLAMAKSIAVNGDTGLYLYDAQQILAGRVQLIEFPSRSPVFEHALALVIWLGDSPLWSARLFMIVISVTLGIAIYVLARRLTTHRVGLASAAIFYATPFPLVWGTWVKTEQAATLLAICAFIVATYYLDRERIPWPPIAAIGVLFGLSFLVRRVAVVHMGAFALFVLWYRHRQGHSHRSTVTAAVGALAVAVATILAAFVVLARGDLAMAWQAFDVHTLALFQSGGQGALGWIEITEPITVYSEDRQNLFFQYVCQKCGTNTALTFQNTWYVVMPAAILALAGIRAWLADKTAPAVGDVLAPGVFAGVPLVMFAMKGPGLDTAALAVAGIGAAVVWATDAAPWDAFWRPTLALPLFVFASLSAGYLWRDRIMYTTYFQDLFPFFAILAGAAAVAWLGANRATAVRIGLAAILVLAVFAGGVHAYPYTEVQRNVDDQWFTVDHADAYGDDLDARTDPGDRVFTAQPLYVIESHALPLADLSRRYYVFRGWPDTQLKEHLESKIVSKLRDGTAPYAINDTNMYEMTNESAAIRTALDEYYCPVDAPVYNETGGQLLAHELTGECG